MTAVDLSLGDTGRIIEECKRQGCTLQHAAYILATAKWETAHTVKPVRETLATSDRQAVDRLERAWRAGRLPWVSSPYWRDGWFGRGYVQLTHRANYKKAGDKLGVDLLSDPSILLKPEISVSVLVRGMMEGWFTGHALPRYIDGAKADYHEARRVVNGTDRAKDIAEVARQYEKALKEAGYGVASPQTPATRTPWGSIIAAIWAVIANLIRKGRP